MSRRSYFVLGRKHKHVLICVAVLTDLPARGEPVWITSPRRAEAGGVEGECGGRLRVGGDVIKLLLKLFRPRRTEYRMASNSENVETKKRPYPTDFAVKRNGIG